MVFSLTQDIATQEMHLEIATIRKTMFKRSENRTEQTFYSLWDQYNWSGFEQNDKIFQFEGQIENIVSFKLYPNTLTYFRMAQILVLKATQTT